MKPQDRTTERSNFLWPMFGVKMEKMNPSVSLRSDVSLTGNIAALANTASTEVLSDFGRENVNRNWLLLIWHFYSSFYLDAFNRESIEYCPHEMIISFDGQYAFNYFRLIPQDRAVYGGFFTVRGYPESIAAGDTAVNIRTQYGYHFGRFFANRHGKMPKWDMIPHLFFDYGYLSNSRKLCYETNHNLVGLGCGLDFKIKNNVMISSDVGIAMNRFFDITNTKNTTPFGSGKFHFMTTFLY
jgi:hemolysin activation/secretion protein